MGGVAPHTCFIQSAGAAVKQASQPFACDTGPIKAMKGEIKRRRILSKGSSKELTLFPLMRVNQNMIVGQRERLNRHPRWRRSIRQSIITKKILKLHLLWYFMQSILLFAGDIHAVYGARHKWTFWKSLSGTVLVCFLLSFLRKSSFKVGHYPSWAEWFHGSRLENGPL